MQLKVISNAPIFLSHNFHFVRCCLCWKSVYNLLVWICSLNEKMGRAWILFRQGSIGEIQTATELSDFHPFCITFFNRIVLLCKMCPEGCIFWSNIFFSLPLTKLRQKQVVISLCGRLILYQRDGKVVLSKRHFSPLLVLLCGKHESRAMSLELSDLWEISLWENCIHLR